MFLFFASLVFVGLFAFFYNIGLWYLSFLPLFFFLFLFSASPAFRFSSIFSRQIFRYPLFFAWWAILCALWWLAWYLGIALPLVFLIILVFNFVLWLVALILSYEDGKQIFSFGYWFSLCLFLFYWLFLCSFGQYFDFLFQISSLHISLLAFALFILRLWFPQLIDLAYYFLVAICTWLVLCVLLFVPDFVVSLVLAWWLLFALYSGLWWFYKQRPVEQKQISVRRILAWERLITKRVFSSLFLAQASVFLHEMPKHFLTSLEFLNIGLVVALLGYFAGHWSSISEITQILYWFVIALFVGNTMLLKRLTVTHIIQNLFLFLIVHFAVYVSFFSYFGSAIWPVVFWTIIWNVFTSGFLFYMERVSSGVLTRLDYWYWLVAAWLWFICNIFLLLQAPIPGELIFFLTLLYLGVEWVLLFYGIKYVGAMESD